VAGGFAALRRRWLARIFRWYIAMVRAGISPALLTATACWTSSAADIFSDTAGRLGSG
jgi:hypothetical protein